MFTRQEVRSLAPGDPTLAAYAGAVSVMKARLASDPTSWTYQANMHGTYDTPVLTAWNGCQHGSFLFVVWHRMYLYYFERIVRAASGDPTFALPYWNYTDPAARAVPLAFREPADASNSLFVAERAPGINLGAELPASSVDYSATFKFTTFLSKLGSGLSFGGQQVTHATHFSRVFGQLENMPHNQIHDQVGGGNGWMGDPNMAARDPIFYLHHANIDRLWSAWLAQGQGRANPLDNTLWMTHLYTFFDENGTAVTMSGKDVVDAAMQLNYDYAAPAAPSAAVVVAAGGVASRRRPATSVAATAAAGVPAVAGVKDGSGMIEFGTEPLTVSVKMESPVQRSVAMLAAPLAARQAGAAQPGAAPHRIVLNLEGMLAPKNPGFSYEVYLNLPAGSEPNFTGDHYVGNVSFFGTLPMSMSDGTAGMTPGMQMSMPGSLSFDVTDKVRALQAQGNWRNDNVSVTFVRRGLVVPAGSNIPLPEPAPGVRATVNRVTLTTE